MRARTGELAKFYQPVQRTIRGAAGKALAPLVKRWRYTQSSDFPALNLQDDTRRFLTRYGTLDAGDEVSASQAKYQELLLRISRENGEAAGVVAAWLDLFAGGSYGVLEKGICSDEPQCTICPLKESCRYLARGGTDARAFGESLAAELISKTREAGLRSADVLAFLLWGERCGAANFQIVEALLKSCGGLRAVVAAENEILQKAGLNDAALSRLRAIGELCKDWAGEQKTRGKIFTKGEDFYQHYHLRLRDLKKEVFIVALLDQKNGLIGDDTVSEGSLTETLVHPREVFAQAIEKRAAALCVIHNHPSGNPEPSPADKAITKRLSNAATILGIRLLDHVIIGDGRFASFVDEGLL